MHVFCDFDGTISTEDATDLVLSEFADPEWREIEQHWKAGQIGSAECMRRQIGLIRATRLQLDRLLDQIAIDPGFPNFLCFCIRNAVPVTVVSDGVDYFIKRILARHGIHSLPVIANTLSHPQSDGQGPYGLFSLHGKPRCASRAGVCKCRAIDTADLGIFVGDGRSDFCVSDKPDVVFAKGALAAHCASRGIPFLGFESFAELPQQLEEILDRVAQRRSAPLRSISA
ncbi:MtnX-like HAD-IB family phosphatase [Rhizobium sp. RAF56]|uniref:MtnX-like HAD-IB family phosphatase n=1 Tax=Rhizobium sp. RAF56 TaxID=3233062 RepID=UPI003F96B15D